MMRRRRLAPLAGWALAALVLGLVFAAYLRPELALTLANQLWNCF
jgi:hypothetical protein